MRQGCYRVNRPQVIFENIDGELILVNMEKGCYFSTDPVGSGQDTLLSSFARQPGPATIGFESSTCRPLMSSLSWMRFRSPGEAVTTTATTGSLSSATVTAWADGGATSAAATAAVAIHVRLILLGLTP